MSVRNLRTIRESDRYDSEEVSQFALFKIFSLISFTHMLSTSFNIVKVTVLIILSFASCQQMCHNA